MIKNFPSFIRDEDGKLNGMQKWQKALVPTFEDFCNELTFQPKTMIIGFDHRIDDFAKSLNIEVPRIGKNETLELVPGFNGVAAWHSYDGRSTDYVVVTTEFNKEKLTEFFQKLTPFITRLEYYHDMSLSAKD